MAIWDYRKSLELDKSDPSFLALLFALMRKADSINTQKLQALWPEEWAEMQQRYNSPGGLLPHEREEINGKEPA